jgi:hypothetical protein
VFLLFQGDVAYITAVNFTDAVAIPKSGFLSIGVLIEAVDDPAAEGMAAVGVGKAVYGTLEWFSEPDIRLKV